MTDPTTGTETTAKKAPGTKTPGNSGSRPEAEPIVPLTVGEADDAASLAIDQKHMEDFAEITAETIVRDFTDCGDAGKYCEIDRKAAK